MKVFYHIITFFTFLRKVRNVRNVMLRVSVVVKKSCPELPWPLHLWLLHLAHSSVSKLKWPEPFCAQDKGARATLSVR